MSQVGRAVSRQIGRTYNNKTESAAFLSAKGEPLKLFHDMMYGARVLNSCIRRSESEI